MAIKLAPASSILGLNGMHKEAAKDYLGNPGLAVQAFFKYGLASYPGKVLTYTDFIGLKTSKGQELSHLASNLREKGGVVLFATLIIDLPEEKLPKVAYSKQGEMLYSIPIPKEFAVVSEQGPVALDFVKSPRNISSARKTQTAVWMEIELPNKMNGILYALPTDSVPKGFFGILASTFVSQFENGPIVEEIYSGNVDLSRASVLLRE